MISTFGCLNGMILMGARLYYAMAKDSLVLPSAGRLNARGVPAVALILQGIWSVGADLHRNVQRTARLRHFRRAALLRDHRHRSVRASPQRTRRAAIVSRDRLSLPAGDVRRACAVWSWSILLIVKPNYTWPGLLIVLAGLPVYLLWRMFGGRGNRRRLEASQFRASRERNRVANDERCARSTRSTRR